MMLTSPHQDAASPARYIRPEPDRSHGGQIYRLRNALILLRGVVRRLRRRAAQ